MNNVAAGNTPYICFFLASMRASSTIVQKCGKERENGTKSEASWVYNIYDAMREHFSLLLPPPLSILFRSYPTYDKPITHHVGRDASMNDDNYDDDDDDDAVEVEFDMEAPPPPTTIHPHLSSNVGVYYEKEMVDIYTCK